LALDGGGKINFIPWLLNPWERDPVHIVQGAGWAPGPVWTGAVNLTRAGIQSLDHPSHSKSLQT